MKAKLGEVELAGRLDPLIADIAKIFPACNSPARPGIIVSTT